VSEHRMSPAVYAAQRTVDWLNMQKRDCYFACNREKRSNPEYSERMRIEAKAYGRMAAVIRKRIKRTKKGENDG